MHPNWVFNQIFGDNLDKIVEEERRLFYVALTRAINYLFIFSEGGDETPFLNDINVKEVNWKNSPPVKLENTHYVVKISNQEEESSSPTVDLKEDLLASSACRR